MKCNKLVRNLMKDEKVTLDAMKNALGYKTVSGVSERLRQDDRNMRVDVLIKMLDYLGYDLIARRREVTVVKENGRDRVIFPEWVIDFEDKEVTDNG